MISIIQLAGYYIMNSTLKDVCEFYDNNMSRFMFFVGSFILGISLSLDFLLCIYFSFLLAASFLHPHPETISLINNSIISLPKLWAIFSLVYLFELIVKNIKEVKDEVHRLHTELSVKLLID